MILRNKCSCCGHPITTKTAKNIGRNIMGLWLNCTCGTSILLVLKKGRERLLNEKKKTN